MAKTTTIICNIFAAILSSYKSKIHYDSLNFIIHTNFNGSFHVKSKSNVVKNDGKTIFKIIFVYYIHLQPFEDRTLGKFGQLFFGLETFAIYEIQLCLALDL